RAHEELAGVARAIATERELAILRARVGRLERRADSVTTSSAVVRAGEEFTRLADEVAALAAVLRAELVGGTEPVPAETAVARAGEGRLVEIADAIAARRTRAVERAVVRVLGGRLALEVAAYRDVAVLRAGKLRLAQVGLADEVATRTA